MQTIAKITGFLILIGLFCSMAFALGWVARARIHENTPKPTVRNQVMSLQKQVGCTMIDAKIGPETTTLVNEVIKEEERQLCNQYAREYFEGEEQ